MDDEDWGSAGARSVAANWSGVASVVGPVKEVPGGQQRKVLRKLLLAVNLTCGAVLDIHRSVFLRMMFLGDVDGVTIAVGALAFDLLVHSINPFFGRRG
jgi:hypothetical protein